jgi:hypothetical protein
MTSTVRYKEEGGHSSTSLLPPQTS